MSQERVTVTYALEEVLGDIKQSIKELNQKIEQLDQKFDQRFERLEEKIDQRFDRIEERLTHLEVGQAKIEEKVEGLSKRVDNQEFVSRGILVGLILTFLAGLAKLFGIVGNP